MRKINDLAKSSFNDNKKFPYPVRSYTDKELREFFALDGKETKKLKTKKA